MSLFICYSLKNKFFPFLKSWPATIPCKKRRRSGQTANKQERQRKKRERQKGIEIDSQRKSKFWFVRMREKQKKPFNYVRLVGKGEKMRFFRYSPAFTKGLKKVTNLFRIGLFPHKKVKFAYCSTKKVCNVKKKNLLCLIKVKGNFLIQMIKISVEQASFKSKMAATMTSYVTSSYLD